MKKKVVITGLGAVTAAGEGAAALWEAAVQGRSAISAVRFDGGTKDPWETAAGVIPDFDPEKFVTQKKALKVMARDIQLAAAGAGLAIKDAGLDTFLFDHDRFDI